MLVVNDDKVAVPPVIVTLLDVKFVTVPVVADSVVKPVTSPPVNVALLDVKFVTVPVAAVRLDNPVTEPPVTWALAVTKLLTVAVLLDVNVVKLPELPEIGVLVIAPPEICAFPEVKLVTVPSVADIVDSPVTLPLVACRLDTVAVVNEPVDPEIGVLAIVPPVNVTLLDAKFVTVPVVADNVVSPVTSPLVACKLDAVTDVKVAVPPVNVTLLDVKFVTAPVVADSVVKPVTSPPVT